MKKIIAMILCVAMVAALGVTADVLDRAKALAEKGFVELTEKAIKADEVETKVVKPKKTTKKK